MTSTSNGQPPGRRGAGSGSGSGSGGGGSTSLSSGSPPSLLSPVGPLTTADVVRLGTAELMEVASQAFRVRCSQDAVLARVCAELDRREEWRASGATSLGGWLVQHLGVSDATARGYAQVAEQLSDLPHLADGLSEGRLSLDKVRTVVGVATPETEAGWAEAAGELSCRDLGELVRSKNHPTKNSDQADREKRSLRFNDALRTIVAQLPPTSYAEVRSVLEARAKKIGSDGKTPFDQRLADALVSLARDGAGRGSAAPLVVAHVPFEVLNDPESTLMGELERGGLISADVARRLACDASIVVTLDDAEGHTMYEGRAERFATEAQRREVWRRDRHCVFPGCRAVLFIVCHHLREWQLGGLTDLPNLALLCEYHHHLIHSKDWSLRGDANVELQFVGPTGQVMTSRPSRLWAQVTDPEVLAERRAALRREGAAEGGTAGVNGKASGRSGAKKPTGRSGRSARSPDRGG